MRNETKIKRLEKEIEQYNETILDMTSYIVDLERIKRAAENCITIVKNAHEGWKGWMIMSKALIIIKDKLQQALAEEKK